MAHPPELHFNYHDERQTLGTLRIRQMANDTFYNAMQVSPERIASLRDVELSALMSALLRVQAHRCGLPSSSVVVNAEEKAKDSGCDGWTDKPVLVDAWLGSVATCWQFKAGTAGQAARLKGEVLKATPHDTLKGGNRVVLVASASTNGKTGESNRKDVLRREASAAGLPDDAIDVFGSERLTTWCNETPAVAARWAGRPSGIWTLDEWAAQEVHQVAWQAEPTIAEQIEVQRGALEFLTGTVQHLHISGPAGVGKTRFALELCRNAPWAGHVVYFPQAGDVRLREVIGSAVSEVNVRMVVVADEVQKEQLVSLRDEVARAGGRVRLVTIGHSGTPDPSRIPALPIHPLDLNRAQSVVRAWHPSMPTEHVDFVVSFAAGYIRLAKLAADAIARNASTNVRDLLSQQAISGFLDRMLGENDRRPLYVVAVLSVVGWTGQADAEGIAIAGHLGLEWNAVRAKVDEFDRRFGIVPRGGRYRYISPTPLGTYLAVEAWTTYPDLLRSLPGKLPTQGAEDAYYDRLKSIASNTNVREYAREELRFFFRLEHFSEWRATQRWSALAAADPEQAAKAAFSALSTSSVESRRDVSDNARREVVSTLVRLAWRTRSFPNAVKALALLAEAENESWANNATAEFVARFQVYLGGTAMPYRDRLIVLDDLVGLNRGAVTSLALRALGKVGETHAVRSGVEPISDELPQPEWRPASRDEYYACVEAACARVRRLAQSSLAPLRDDFVNVAIGLAMMLRDNVARDDVAKTFRAVFHSYPDTREPLRRAIADVSDRERNYWKVLSSDDLGALDALHAEFVDDSLTGRLEEIVGQRKRDLHAHPDLSLLANELLASPSVVREMSAWLTSGNANYGWELGEAIGNADQGEIFVDFAEEMYGAGDDLRLPCGYFFARKRLNGDDWYGAWFQSMANRPKPPVRLLFDVTWRCGASTAVVQSLVRLLQTMEIEAEIVGKLAYGAWGEALEPQVLLTLVHAIIDAKHYATALAIVEHRTRVRVGEIRLWCQLALELVVRPDMIRSNNMMNYFWKELALRYAHADPLLIASRIVQEHAARSGKTWFIAYTGAEEVLLAIADRYPESVWNALLPFLDSKEMGGFFGIGFPAKVFGMVSPTDVLAWIGHSPTDRAPRIAGIVGTDLSSDTALAAQIAGAYGDHDDVSGALFSQWLSGGWSGSTAAHWEELAASLDDVARRTELPRLRSWAERSAHSLREMAERDRDREAEHELRRL